MEKKPPHIALKARDLSIGYRKRKQEKLVREGLQLKLRSSELLCLMGPNGSGKSTLLRTLAGIQAPLSGEVLVADQQLHQLSQVERARHISLVLTESISAGNMSVLELVVLGRYPHTGWGGRLSGKDQEIVQQALQDLGIAELADRKLYELSDGQRQKALIARALAQDGQLIILDEPTAHLDLINRLQIMRLLKNLALIRRKAIVVATHELDLALQSADRLWLLGQEGMGLSEGAPEDLVLDGSLAKAFSRTGFHFDAENGQFVEEIESCVPVQLKAEGQAGLWTRRALKRKGYQAVCSEAPIELEVKHSENGFRWKLRLDGKESFAYSIAALLEQLADWSDRK